MVGCKNSTVAKINDIKISKDYYSKIESFLYTTGYIEDKNIASLPNLGEILLLILITNFHICNHYDIVNTPFVAKTSLAN